MSYAKLLREVERYNRETSELIGRVNLYDEPKKAYVKKLNRMTDLMRRLRNVLTQMACETQKNVIQMERVDWSKNAPMDSLTFRIRYLILILQEFETKMHIILAKLLERKGIHKEIVENAYFDMDYVFDHVMRYMFTVLEGKNSFCFLGLKIHLYLMDGNPNKGYGKRYRHELVTAVNDLKAGLESGFFKSQELPDDIAMDTIIKLAFMLATGSRKFDRLPRFTQIEGHHKEDDMSQVIRLLGKAIMQKAKKRKDRTPGYRAFEDANPRLGLEARRTMCDEFMITGYRAIMYLKFICSDKSVSEFIDTMVI